MTDIELSDTQKWAMDIIVRLRMGDDPSALEEAMAFIRCEYNQDPAKAEMEEAEYQREIAFDKFLARPDRDWDADDDGDTVVKWLDGNPSALS